jgi:DNA invertase Pin-like site-specific DNA recombinase
MIRAYARVSSKDQLLDSQLALLKKDGYDKLYQEKVSGVATERKVFELLMKEIEPGDTLLVARMDRIARSMNQLIRIVSKLENRGIHVKTLDFKLDTRTSTGRMLFKIVAAIAEWEREMLKEKQRIGIEEAKKNGKHLGRPTGSKNCGIRSPKMKLAIQLYLSGEMQIKDICNATGVSKSSLYRRVNELKRGNLQIRGGNK